MRLFKSVVNTVKEPSVIGALRRSVLKKISICKNEFSKARSQIEKNRSDLAGASS